MRGFGSFIVLLGIILSGASSTKTHAQQAVQLFNGVDLSGWSVLGGEGVFDVVAGAGGPEIRGVSSDTQQNTFLVTDASFDDFELELEFRIDQPPPGPAYNSGVQVRSQSLPSHNNGRVFGYQVEIDPSDRAWSGGLYFEGGSPHRPAGWLDDLSDNAPARAAFVLGDWNHFRVLAEGNRIRTWINNVPAADYADLDVDALLPSGFIGLQVHSVTTGSMEVRFRNLSLIETGGGVLGDFNDNGVLDAGDYALLMQNMHLPAPGNPVGDLTGDGLVDFHDHRYFRDLFENVHGSGSFSTLRVVPEPAALVLAISLFVTLRKQVVGCRATRAV